jgi:hypothetical protein
MEVEAATLTVEATASAAAEEATVVAPLAAVASEEATECRTSALA